MLFFPSIVNFIFIGSYTRDVQKCVSASKHVISSSHGPFFIKSAFECGDTYAHPSYLYIYFFNWLFIF